MTVSMSRATAKPNTKLEDILKVAGKSATTTTKAAAPKESRFANISTNPFYKLAFDESLSPEQKQSAVAKLLVFSGTREESREKVKAFDQLKEFLQQEREAMATQIIKMSDTETFAVLQNTFQEINESLISFENDMRPLTDILDALHDLRADNQTLDAFREIKDEQDRKTKIDARDAELKLMIDETKEQIDNLSADNIVQRQKKKFFGLGDLTQEAIQALATNEVRKSNLTTKIEKLAEEANKNKGSNTVESKVVNKDAKEQLRKMLNLSTSEHQDRSKKLVASAIKFVETSKEKVGTVRDHLTAMDAQIHNLDDANGKMTFVYAILGEGVKEAEVVNKSIREKILSVPTIENMVEKLIRETKQRDINDYIQRLEVSSMDTQSTVADLTTAGIRIKNMIDNNQDQMERARNIHSRGIAGVADRISTVVQAVGAAALAEANSMTAETLRTMTENTDVISQKESMRIAGGMADKNADVIRAIESLAQYGEVNKAATDIIRLGAKEMQENLRVLEQTSTAVAESLLASKSVIADEVMGTKTEQLDVSIENPFKL